MQRGQALVGLFILPARDGRPLPHPGAVFYWLFPLLSGSTTCSSHLLDWVYLALDKTETVHQRGWALPRS